MTTSKRWFILAFSTTFILIGLLGTLSAGSDNKWGILRFVVLAGLVHTALAGEAVGTFSVFEPAQELPRRRMLRIQLITGAASAALDISLVVVVYRVHSSVYLLIICFLVAPFIIPGIIGRIVAKMSRIQ